MKLAWAMLLVSGCVVPLELLGPPVPDAGVDSGTSLPLAATLSVGAALTCVTAQATGALFCFGDNALGQRGVGDTAAHFGPTRVDAGTVRWVSAAAGDRHACALATNADAYCWGDNGDGALGTGDTAVHLTPARVEGSNFRSLSAGDGYTCALDAAGTLWCWGRNGEGQLGQTDAMNQPASSPAPLAVGGQYRQVAAGQGHVCALGIDGGLACWGRNTEGQLGSGSTMGNLRGPTPVLDGPWLSVSATQGSTCAIKADRTLWCWGEGLSIFSRVPVQVGAASGWTEISANEFHFCGRRGTELSCWGRGIEGQLGLSDTNPRPAPTVLGGSWRAVGAGRFHTCGVQTDGRLFCWGKNDLDELGLGDSARRSSPTVVSLP